MSPHTPPPLRELADATEALPEDVQALRASLPTDLSSVHPEGSPWARRAVLGTATMLAAAAALMLVLRSPTPVDPPLAADLASMEDAGSLEVGEHFRLAYDGRGRLEGSVQQPRLHWESGTVTVDVDPGQHVDMVVQTRDAEVRVVGTVFTVTRDLRGTTVEVQRGEVAVTCQGEAASSLLAGSTQTCMPTTAGGLLARARTQQRSKESSAAVLSTVDRGLALADPGSAASMELRVVRMHELSRDGQAAAALAEAQTYLATDYSLRRDFVLRLALENSVKLGSCEGVEGFLGSLGAEATDRDRQLSESCRSEP